MLSRALLVLGVARVCAFASIRKIGGSRVGVSAESTTMPAGIASDPFFCTNVQQGGLTQVDSSKWCGSLTKDVCGESYDKVKSFRIEPANGNFNGCIWNPLEGDSGKCVYSQVYYRCHPSCQGGAGNLTMVWPSPPPPPSPSPPARRELDAITAGRSLDGEEDKCTGEGCPDQYQGPNECTNGWSKAIAWEPKCDGNEVITSISCSKGTSGGCTCSNLLSRPSTSQCIDVVGNFWEKKDGPAGTGFTCCLSASACPPPPY